MMHFGVVTLLPEMFACLDYGVIGKAIIEGIAKIECWNPRDWALNAHRQVDDRPYGGGPGMVMMYEPLHAAIVHAKQQMRAPCKTVYLSPQGRRIDQQLINESAVSDSPLVFVAGRYAGIDERLIEEDIDEEWSIGDFVLSGGELAAMACMDAIIRLLPGALGHTGSASKDSFMDGLLESPHYTRPVRAGSRSVPEVLLGGSHVRISQWRRKQALGRTWLKRPDLLANKLLSTADERLLIEFKNEQLGLRSKE